MITVREALLLHPSFPSFHEDPADGRARALLGRPAPCSSTNASRAPTRAPAAG
jgi:hypothetical protein